MYVYGRQGIYLKNWLTKILTEKPLVGGRINLIPRKINKYLKPIIITHLTRKFWRHRICHIPGRLEFYSWPSYMWGSGNISFGERKC
jgi:hypothetical protein